MVKVRDLDGDGEVRQRNHGVKDHVQLYEVRRMTEMIVTNLLIEFTCKTS